MDARSLLGAKPFPVIWSHQNIGHFGAWGYSPSKYPDAQTYSVLRLIIRNENDR